LFGGVVNVDDSEVKVNGGLGVNVDGVGWDVGSEDGGGELDVGGDLAWVPSSGAVHWGAPQ